MQFFVGINQLKSLEWGLNLQQAALFAFLYEVPSWAECQTIDGVAYWRIAKSKIIAELPILTDKRDTVYRHMKALEDAGLIEKIQNGDITLIRVTKKGAEWNKSEGSEKNPRGRIKSEGSEKNPATPGKKSDTPSEKNPTYQYTNISNNQDHGDSARGAVAGQPKKAKRAEQIPDDFQPNDTNRRIAGELGVSIPDQLPRFVDHHRAKGTTFKDWHAAFNNWIRKAADFGQQNNPAQQPAASASPSTREHPALAARREAQEGIQ